MHRSIRFRQPGQARNENAGFGRPKAGYGNAIHSHPVDLVVCDADVGQRPFGRSTRG